MMMRVIYCMCCLLFIYNFGYAQKFEIVILIGDPADVTTF